ncbi:adenosine deaminase [Actinospica durhamensis]|uniref:Adenosine deaminase n=1 Tax=Actinospica durhamensis TaxID=1508375 RepID=A0A941EU04_9ACTN|nr:adenosine deaminase [Actinospica durhamensis]MBR7836377.1 adenosine deaminase [Actinospica durhamensis]
MQNPDTTRGAADAAGDGPERRDLAGLPKAEMHLHLLGAMRESTLVELAAVAGLRAPDPRAFTTFDDFQEIFQASFAATQTRLESLLRLVREVVEDAAADGVVWVQPHFDPHLFPAFGTPDEIMELVLAEGRASGARLGVGFGVTLGAMRHRGPQAVEELAGFAARWAGRGVHAFGLTGDEAAFPPAPFARAFAIARDAGLEAAPHAGELAGAESVRSAVEDLGAGRIAHGVHAVDDPALMDLLAQRGVTLDVCLTSNAKLGVYPDPAEHPLPRLLAAGVPCSLGADDPLMFGAGLLDEYHVARTVLGLDDRQLAALARTSIASSGAPDALKTSAAADIDAWLSS